MRIITKLLLLSLEEDEEVVLNAVMSALGSFENKTPLKEEIACEKLAFEGMEIDASKRLVYRGEKEVNITFTEFEILHLLARNPGRVFSKEQMQEKNKLDMLMKKAKAEQRKADNHRKIVVGANFETFLTEPRRYSEQQTRRIMQVAFATREVKNCMEQIERELAGAEQKMPDTAINKETGEGESEEE